MGRSDSLLKPMYANLLSVHPQTVAVLGSPGPYFVTEMLPNSRCDYFDMQLKNWDINSEWSLGRQYEMIISTRCPYFAKNPQDFINRCAAHLVKNGIILLDWGYGDHWRFPQYKIGWVKNGEQEYCYGNANYLWSGIWDDSFLKHPQFQQFASWVFDLGYQDVKQAIFEETPAILPLSHIQQIFNTRVEMLALWKNRPQLYIFILGQLV